MEGQQRPVFHLRAYHLEQRQRRKRADGSRYHYPQPTPRFTKMSLPACKVDRLGEASSLPDNRKRKAGTDDIETTRVQKKRRASQDSWYSCDNARDLNETGFDLVLNAISNRYQQDEYARSLCIESFNRIGDHYSAQISRLQHQLVHKSVRSAADLQFLQGEMAQATRSRDEAAAAAQEQTEKILSSKDDEIARLRMELSQASRRANDALEEKEAQIQALFEEGQRVQDDYASTSNELQVALECVREQDSVIASLRSENQSLSGTSAGIKQEHATALEVQQEMQCTIEGLKSQVEVLEARYAQAEKDEKPDADMEDANDDDQEEEDSTIDDSGFVDMDSGDNESALERSSPQGDPDGRAKRTTEKSLRSVKPSSLNTVRNKQIGKKGAEKSNTAHGTSLKRFVAASEKPRREQSSKDIKSTEALQQIVQDEQVAEQARQAENMKEVMNNSNQFFDEGEYRYILYNKMLYNPEKTEFVLFIKREAGRQPVRAVVTQQNMHRDMESQLLLPWPEQLLWMNTLDVELTRMKFAVACLYAQIPDVQAEAAKAFLTKEEHIAFCGRCFGKGMLRAPLSCKQDLSWPNKWDEAVKTLSTYKRFQTAARLWAKGEKASDELRCWPPTFLDVKKQQSCTIHQDQEEQEAAEEYTTTANPKAVNDLTEQAAANLLLNF